MIAVPDIARSAELVVSMSGGKDSTATALALREAGLTFRMVFADTGWEAPETYAHLDHLRERIGPIDVVGHPGGLVAVATKKAGFPSRRGRWCTETLKVEPLKAYHAAIHATGSDTVSVVGIRGEESDRRAAMPEVEDCERWGGWVWRPILRWSIEDVLSIHHRHGVEINPLYKRGHSRVGCYPCIMENFPAGVSPPAPGGSHIPHRKQRRYLLAALCRRLRPRPGADGGMVLRTASDATVDRGGALSHPELPVAGRGGRLVLR